MPNDFLKIIKPSTEAERSTRTTLDTIEVTPHELKSWKVPPFQRPLRVNEKVKALAVTIKDDSGVIPGILTIGILDKQRYILDGQHRREAFLLSECLIGYVDVRIAHFDSMAEMGEEFVNLNSQLVRMRPDDILRGLEGTHAPVAKVRRRCPFVGYDMIRRGEKSPMLSMSALLRCWFASSPEVPSAGGLTSVGILHQFTDEEADNVIAFLDMAMHAWGRDVEYQRLWLNLNLTLCMWLFRRLVIANTSYSARTHKVSKELFAKLLMSLSADESYLDWLVGRQLRDRDRSPCYGRIRSSFAARFHSETGKKATFPSPAWASSSSRLNRKV
jgi:hypothetical protein